MKKCFSLSILFFVTSAIFPQTGKITLEDIWVNYKFYSQGIYGLNSMNDGLHYTVNTGTAIEKFEYATGNTAGNIFETSMTNGMVTAIDDYAFNDDETAVMLKTNVEPRYRWATFDENYIYNFSTKTTTKLSERGKQMYADFAPAGNKVAYVFDNNLYYKDLNTNIENSVTSDGKLNSIINGGSDWVYEEEFALIRSFEWSPDGNKIAYYRFDETEVPEFYMTTFKGELYPQEYKFKYPKVGEKNSKVEIYIYDLATKSKIKVNTGSPEYIPRIKWIDNNRLCVTTMNRLQNDLKLLSADATTGTTSLLLNETSETYIEIKDDLTFLQDNKGFIWSSERDGYNHLYHFDMTGKLVQQITKGNWDVTEFKGYDAVTDNVFFLSAEISPFERHLYCIKLNGKKKEQLTNRKGMNSAEFSEGYKYYISTNTTYTTPEYVTLHDGDGKQIRVLEENYTTKEYLQSLALASHEYFSFKTSKGVSLNGFMLKPRDFDPNKKYPVFMYVYGGPGSQTVLDSYDWVDFGWYNMLTQMGFIVVSVDNRGTGARGRDFRNVTYEQLGKYETDDQIEAAKYLGTLSYIDKERIGIFGWSYGGYMAALCITRGADVFKTAISVAPVSNWKYYDNIYTERYMGTLETNPDGFDANSPTSFADKLKGNYLLVHGTGDDNVHVQNTYEWINALIKNNKQFELMVYPDRNHGIYGGTTRYHLYELMTDFIMENL
ncbi:MAG: S9 family peptidase [Chitinophagales bacterium]